MNIRCKGVLLSWFGVGIPLVNALGNILVTGPSYSDLQLVVQNNPFNPIRIYGESKVEAKIRCGRVCGWNTGCHAFNIYFKEPSYVCELLPTNMALDSNRIALVPKPGSSSWEKLTKVAVALPFMEQKLVDVLPANKCETIRTGCKGIWPNCDDCVKTCWDCVSRYGYFSKLDKNILFRVKIVDLPNLYIRNIFTCTIWPGPPGPNNTPVVASCFNRMTYLARRNVNLTNGAIVENHILPFPDMNRLCRLNFYKFLQFKLYYYGGWYYETFYNNPTVTEQGTLMNLTYYWSNLGLAGDSLNVFGKNFTAAPFVVVDDDRYNCGSFWLLDTSNATYCPGGKVSFFGTPKLNTAGKVIDSGIHWPYATTYKITLYSAELLLYA